MADHQGPAPDPPPAAPPAGGVPGGAMRMTRSHLRGMQ